MLDREVRLTGPEPENATHIPAAGEARVKRQRALYQPDHGADILTEVSQHLGGIGEGRRIVLRCLERLSGKIDGLATNCLRRCGPAGHNELSAAYRRPGKGRPVMRIDRDRLI